MRERIHVPVEVDEKKLLSLHHPLRGAQRLCRVGVGGICPPSGFMQEVEKSIRGLVCVGNGYGSSSPSPDGGRMDYPGFCLDHYTKKKTSYIYSCTHRKTKRSEHTSPTSQAAFSVLTAFAREKCHKFELRIQIFTSFMESLCLLSYCYNEPYSCMSRSDHLTVTYFRSAQPSNISTKSGAP